MSTALPSTGSRQANKLLSDLRAQMVVDQLQADGLDSDAHRTTRPRLGAVRPDLAGKPARGNQHQPALKSMLQSLLQPTDGMIQRPSCAACSVSRFPRPAGTGGAPCHRRRRRAGADADRRRQEHLLPGARTVPARHRGGDLAADRADGRPGGGAAPAWRGGRRAAFRPGSRRSAQRDARSGRAAARSALRLARTAAGERHAGAAVSPAAGVVRHRRGALRLAMGPRVPSGISRTGLPGGTLPRQSRAWR